MVKKWSSRGTSLSDFNKIAVGDGSSIQIEQMSGRSWIKQSIDDPTKPSDAWSNYKCRAEVQCLESWVNTEYDMWYGARYDIPTDWRVDEGTGAWDNGCKIWQLHEGPSQGYGASLNFWAPDQNLRVNNNQYNFSADRYEQMNYARDIPLIKGRPFVVMFHVNAVQNGVFQCYIDGELVVDRTGDFRVGPLAAPRVSRYFKTGVYCGINQNQKHLFTTDFIAATTKKDLDDWFNGGEELSFVNETTNAVAVYKRPIVVDEFVGNVPAGGSIDVDVDETKEKLVIKNP